jgi:alpha-amylase
MAAIRFAFVVHNHQPPGNLHSVFESVCNRAYRPFLDVVRRHPDVSVVLHYSGGILKWLESHRPHALDTITHLVAEGRAEMMTGGFYEPILPIIPDRDKVGQVRALTGYLRERFAADPRGLWLPERVWQPDLISPLVRAGVEYTLVDDNNFQLAGLSEKQSLGYFRARAPQGETLNVFPINAVIRRAIPFQPPEAVIDHLRWLAEDGDAKLAVFADDGEKFGEWPGTHELVYENHWLDRFFGLLAENADWLETVTLTDFMRETPPEGRIDLPPGSYPEMMEWSGGSWQNFLDRYAESNLMYRKMLLVSDEVAEMTGTGEDLRRARDHLYRAQANCPYWHGAFGGLYLLHLRLDTYSNLISAENIAEPADGVRVRRRDHDGDGREEVLVSTRHLNCYLHPIGGQAFELDCRAVPWNILATLGRRPERYHEWLGDSEQGRQLLPLHYDWYSRRGLIDHFLRDDTTLDSFAVCEYGEQGDFANQPYQIWTDVNDRRADIVLRREGGVWVENEFHPITVTKRLSFTADLPSVGLAYEIEHAAYRPLSLWFACESNFVLSAGAGEGRYYRFEGSDDTPPLDSTGTREAVSSVALVDDWLGCQVRLRFSEPTQIWTFALLTVSQGLEGPTEAYQGSCVTASWRLDIPPREPWRASMVIELAQT